MTPTDTSDFSTIFSDGLPQFLDTLPPVVRERLQVSPDLDSLIEVVLDLGRPAEARYRERVERIEAVIVSELDIDYVVKSIGEFGQDNRAGIERTLHRISCIRNRQGKIVGLTCRVGRALEGTIDIIDDIVRSGQSILLLGKPGIGKTTKLREVARVLSDEAGRRVVIVDTSNEIAGDGDVPHPGIGFARRMQVPRPSEQHQVMIEAVENHMPEVIVIDEIGSEQEAAAARTIAERGVQLVGTAHGQTLENLMLNPTLCDLIGGIQAVTLSDEEARRRGTQKTVLERKSPPTFDIVIELLDYDRLAVHRDVMKTVDLILRGLPPRPEIRVRTSRGEVEVFEPEATLFEEPMPIPPPVLEPRIRREPSPAKPRPVPKFGSVRVYPYGIARTRLERAIREKGSAVVIVNEMEQADAVIAIRSTVASKPAKLRNLSPSVPTVVVKSNTFSQINAAVEEAVRSVRTIGDLEQKAIDDVHEAVAMAHQSGKSVELAPQDARVRRLQIAAAEAKRAACECVGIEPRRFVRILPTKR